VRRSTWSWNRKGNQLGTGTGSLADEADCLVDGGIPVEERRAGLYRRGDHRGARREPHVRA
jgi:hypothetical protein